MKNQQARIELRGKDWLVRTDAPPTVAALFRYARIALPPRACQASPPPAVTIQPKQPVDEVGSMGFLHRTVIPRGAARWRWVSTSRNSVI